MSVEVYGTSERVMCLQRTDGAKALGAGAAGGCQLPTVYYGCGSQLRGSAEAASVLPTPPCFSFRVRMKLAALRQ